MLTRVRRRRPELSGDAGISLVEMLVAMTLSVILGAITMTLFVQVSSSASDTTDRSVNSALARDALQAWSGYLQVADDPTATGTTVSRFEWFTPTSILFYADLNNRSGSVGTTSAPTLIWLRLDTAGRLVEEQLAASPSSYPEAATACRVLVQNVTATQLFTPYDATGRDLTGQSLGVSPTVGSGCQSLPSAPTSKQSKPDATVVADLQNVVSVAITFAVSDVHNAHPLSFTTTLGLPIVAGT